MAELISDQVFGAQTYVSCVYLVFWIELDMSETNIDQAIRQLEAAGYCVLRPVRRPISYGELPKDPKKTVPLLIVDVETTGLDAEKDKAIELAAMLVECSISAGCLGDVIDVYDGFEDPGFPIPEEITKTTGIRDEDVAGQKFDDEKIQSMIGQARLVIAHNALLDRSFLDIRFPEFEQKWWACSYKEGPWEEMGVGSSKQDYLAFKVAGVHYEAHRAINDVEALAEVLEAEGVNGKSVLRNIIDKTMMNSYQIWVTGAPFDIKDDLKKAGYSWCGEDKTRNGEKVALKSWNKMAFGDEALEAEKAFLASVYPGGKIIIDVKDGRTRYSDRKNERLEFKLPNAKRMTP